MATEATSLSTVSSQTVPVHNSSDTIDKSDDVFAHHGDSATTDVNGSDAGAGSAKAELLRSKDAEKSHVRTSSTLKKPTSFKSVSVNKTFLAAKSSSTSITKVADKPIGTSSLAPSQSTPSVVSASRPRLVAKSGSGQSLSRSGLASGKPAAAPDPNAVWNKNKPTPAPDRKAMTDEELRNKYGIHMATRLNADDMRGQGNWADIDDDDEDWTPEAISWADGTKSKLPNPEENTPAPPPAPIAPPSAVETKSHKEKSPIPSNTSSPSIKPGVLASGKGLVLKGAPEKPTLVAKPPAPPTPIKSPWATLPPVSKSSPIVADATPQPGHRQAVNKEPPLATKSPYPGPKEIAADDFSRPDTRGSSNRELFNSQSSKYEPVGERHSSHAHASSNKHTTILQKMSHTDTAGPAEPSPAFQTSRTSSHEGPYMRRRGSSNVSGGSGGFIPRFAKGSDTHVPPTDTTNHRRNSMAGTSDSHESPQTWQARGPPRQQYGTSRQTPYNHDQINVAAPPASATETQSMANNSQNISEFEFQKQLMRERIEAAKKRRLEEEAREEQARRERIRIKLEAMGPAPERKSEKNAARSEAQRSTETPSAEPVTFATAGEGADATGVPSTDAKKASVEALPEKLNGISNPTSPVESTYSTSRLSIHDRSTWNTSAGPDRFSGWGSSGSHTHASKIWGPPNNNRTLGNGTFSSDLSRVPELHPTSSTSVGPGPIAPPTSTKVTAPTSEDVHARLPPIGPPTRPAQHDSTPSLHPGKDNLEPASHGTETSSAQVLRPTEHQASQRPSQTFNATTNRSSSRNTTTSVEQRVASMAAWRNPNLVQQSDRALALENKKRVEEQERELQARGLSLDEAHAPIEDEWRAVSLGDRGFRTDVQKVEVEKKGGAAWNTAIGAAAKSEQQQHLILSSGGAAPSASAVRGSRFFPSRDRQEETQPTESMRGKSPSPPPPTSDGHPAYDGDASHPHVALPPQKPRVKLPPSRGYSQQTSKPPSEPVTTRRSSQARSSQSHWQAKIHDLLGDLSERTRTTHKSMVVDSFTKHALDHAIPRSQPTIALPSISSSCSVSTSSDETSYTTRPMDEDCFEEQEMGSLPTVRLPKDAPEQAYFPLVPMLNQGRLPKGYRLINPSTKDTFSFETDSHYKICLPGMEHTIRLDKSPTQTSSNRGSRGRGSSRQSTRRSNKPRDGNSTFSSDSSRPSSGRTGRGGRYQRQDTWSRNASSQLAA